MVSLKNKQSGLTIVELLIVIVVIGILAALVITTFAGVQQRARNAERQTDVNAIAGQLEGVYAKTGTYPILTEIQDGTWRTSNEWRLDDKAYADPSGTTTGPTALTGTATATAYGYAPTPAACTGTTGATPCTGYTLTALQEGGKPNLTKTSAN